MLEKVGSGEALPGLQHHRLLRSPAPEERPCRWAWCCPRITHWCSLARRFYLQDRAQSQRSEALLGLHSLKRGQTVMSEKSLVYSLRSDVPGQYYRGGPDQGAPARR